MKRLGHILFLSLLCTWVQATVLAPDLPDEGVLGPDKNGYFNEDVDYTRFSGRVTDKDKTGRVLKIKVENNNTKFFTEGDYLEFYLNLGDEKKRCVGYVRSSENFYFTMYVQDFSACYGDGDKYFRRGTLLHFKSEVLAKRVYEGSKMRELLMLKKNDFLTQLNGINHFLWSFDQEKIKVTADYDRQINELLELKRKAIDRLIDKKKENLNIQAKLMKQLTTTDEELKFYRVERQELMIDRWNMDHDSGLPFSQRPQVMKKL